MDLEGIKTLDLFGGTGSISYELASRGAADLTVIEKDAAMYSFIKGNMDMLKVENYKIIRLEVFSYLNSCTEQFNFIFAGPPYALGSIDELPKIIISKKLIAPKGYFVLEHTPRNTYENFAGFQFQRNYGTTVFSFFTNE
jgi:16S rRNA (guanine(966)-N(2))-methyltransferase RsmD